MAVSTQHHGKGPPVAFTDAAVVDAFRRIPEFLARDAALMARGRLLDVDCLLGPTVQPFHIAIRAGAIVDMTPAPVLMRSSRFSYLASPRLVSDSRSCQPAGGIDCQ